MCWLVDHCALRMRECTDVCVAGWAVKTRPTTAELETPTTLVVGWFYYMLMWNSTRNSKRYDYF